ncbi:S1C family serine protease [Larkinella terrae]|uniref:Trypsin-like serine protease n=1 Tax=Larkinella terrae TaxID=2025311 RepID=A0A7K0ET13_9BACT|nr:serine protease [Larkinella terrae]MRS64661.1 trypsin-like serine protease [Larkinella terrae]
MIDNQKFTDWIDRWLRNELTETERLEFEALRRSDPVLAQRALEQQQLVKAMKNYGQRTDFRSRLNRIHANLDMDCVREEVNQLSKVRKLHRNGGTIRQLWQTYRPILAVAASVALITTFGTLMLIRQYQSSHKQQEQYSMMRRDLQAIRRSQNAILQDLNARERALQINPGQVAGSGFLLSPDGYLVTNTHIIQDADSVYIQSTRGDIYKAKVVYADNKYDLAILQIHEDSSFRVKAALPYGFEAAPSDLGERVFTLGFPREEVVYGEGYLSSQTGYRGDSTAYQVAISVNPGNSGGPLLDEKGNVIGIISGKQTSSEGATFAIKTDYLFRAISAIPTDSLKNNSIRMSRKNGLAKLARKDQIKKIQENVYMVKVFKHEK